MIFSNSAKIEEKATKKNENEGKFNNLSNKNCFKENFDTDFDKYMVNDFNNENNFDLNKKYDVLDLSENSSIGHSGNDKKNSKETHKTLENKNKFNNFNIERKNSISSNSNMSEASIQSSKKSTKFEKNIEKIKNISSNLVDDDFLLKLLNKIDTNLNSDKLNSSRNNINNTSLKTSNFEMLEKNYPKEKSIKEIEIEENLSKSNHSELYDNNPKTNVVGNNLANNLTNNNASIYHSFGETNQFVPTFKIIYNKELNENNNNELVENNSIELAESLNNSKIIHQEDGKKKYFGIFLEKLEIKNKNFCKSYFKLFFKNTHKMIQSLTNLERIYYISTFFKKIERDKRIKIKKSYIIDRNNRISVYKEEKKEINKRNIFNEFRRMCRNQSEWVKKLKYEFKKNDLWFIKYI